MLNLRDLTEDIAGQFQGLNGRHPGQWPLAPRILCGVGALLITAFFGWFFYWSGQLEALEQGRQKEGTLKEAYKTKIHQAINLSALENQKKLVSQYVSTLEKQLPSKAEMDALLSDINQAGLGRGLQFELFKPGQVMVKDYYAELPIEIRISGNFHDLGEFTSDIANLPRIVTLNNLSVVAANDGVLTLDAVAKTFRYLDQDELAEQRKAAASKKGAGK